MLVRAAACCAFAATAAAGPLIAQRATGPLLSADQLLSVGSIVADGVSGGENQPTWNPDGSGIAFVTGLGGGLGIWTVSRSGGTPRLLVDKVPLEGVEYTAGQHPLWSPKGNGIAYVSTKGGDAPEIWVWSPRDGQDRQLTHMGGAIYSMSWSPDGTRIAFSDDRYGSQDVYVVSVAGGDVLRLTSDPRFEDFPTWTPDSRMVVYDRVDLRWVDHDLFAIPADGSAPPRLIVSDRGFFDYRGGASLGYSWVSPDGTQLLFRSQRSGFLNYWTVPMTGGVPHPIAAESADQSEAQWSPDGKWIAYIGSHNGTKGLYLVSAAGGAPRGLVAPSDGVVSQIGWSPDGSHLSYAFGTTTSPADLYLVDIATGKPTQLTWSLPAGLPEAGLEAPRKIAYSSPDGLTINAYLYEPRGLKAGTKAPGILLVHGGPTGQWVDSYEPVAQFLAARGYAVLLPNIRGSEGYGLKFEDANNRCWGICDMKDVVAGVEYLKRQPYVDPDAMGITGISYGGCLTMSAVVNAPGVFQAAIAESGYGDWEAFLQFNTEKQHDQLLAYEFGPWPDSQAVYRRLSPIHNVERVTTPILFIYGEGQTAAWRPKEPPVPASLDFAHALDSHYKPYRIKTYPGETYYIEGQANNVQKFADIAAFFDQYLKDGLRTGASARVAEAK